MKRYLECECIFSDFCERHVEPKTIHEYRRCKSSDFYRRQKDIMTYGFTLDNLSTEEGVFVKNIQSNLKRAYVLKKNIDEEYKVDKAQSSNTKLYVLGHSQAKLDSLPELEHTQKINLEQIDYGKYSKYAIPELCENRFYFYDFECPETVGTVTSSWREKYVIPNVQIENFFDWEESKVLFSNPDENIVLCAFYAHLQKYENQNKYFEDLLYDLELQDLRNTGVWANQIICKREIFQELKEFMIEAIIKLLDLHKKCDLFSGPQHSKFNLVRYNNRGLGLLAEEISARWFCNREDVTLIEVQKINPSWYH